MCAKSTTVTPAVNWPSGCFVLRRNRRFQKNHPFSPVAPIAQVGTSVPPESTVSLGQVSAVFNDADSHLSHPVECCSASTCVAASGGDSGDYAENAHGITASS